MWQVFLEIFIGAGIKKMRKRVRINVNSNLYKLGKDFVLMLVRVLPTTYVCCSFV